jgi:hypothetical protein
MSDTPKVSICLPVYNGEQYLAQALESIVNQTFTDFEVVVCDDSTENLSMEILQKYASKDKRFVVKKNAERLGLFANYNECIKRSCARIIKLMAQDDVMEPSLVERSVRVMEEHQDVVFVTAAKTRIDAQDTPIQSITEWDRLVTSYFNSDAFLEFRDVAESVIGTKTNWIGEPTGVTFSVDAIGDGFDTAMYQLGDMDFWLRILKQGRGYYISEPLYKYRIHDLSESKRNSDGVTSILDYLRIAEKHPEVLNQLQTNLGALCSKVLIDWSSYALTLEEDVLRKLLKQRLASIPESKSPDKVTDCIITATILNTAGFLEQQRASEAFTDELQAQLSAARQENATLHQRLREEQHELLTVTGSQSWKLTAPLRRIKQLLSS